MVKKRGLGRGLEALLGEVSKKNILVKEIASQNEVYIESVKGESGSLQFIDLEQLQTGKYQPRRNFSEKAINELVDSIKAQGIIQPIVVRTIKKGKYEIVAGERRWRAAKQAGLKKIPALVKELPDEAAIALALIENIQREDLNVIEEALALQRLIDEFEMTHQQVANAVGKSRTSVSNLLRLLGLDPSVRKMVEDGQLEMGHARALLSLAGPQQISIAERIIEKGLSVRDAEQYVRQIQNLAKSGNVKKEVPFEIQELQQTLEKRVGAKVLLQENASGRGKIIIKYRHKEHLNKILEKIQS